MTDSDGSEQPPSTPEMDDSVKEKQAMVEKLFRHTNEFLQQNKQDPLLVVEALAAILVRYAALLGPVEQMPARLAVLENLIGQECKQIQEIAQAAAKETIPKP
ncbi:MAG: hypothetical protein O3C28_02980 [Proteobacteria bacterium]|nr:hypothetical protein [Pseudomonadota bacterium]